MAADEAYTVHLRLEGRVQGVWFRGWAVDEASALGLRGWVRNRRDGSVEALLIGSEAAVETMVLRCHDGPPGSRVDHVARVTAHDDGSVGFRQVASV